MTPKEKVDEIAKRLSKEYPDVHVELDYNTTFEPMNASILAAQNGDTTINKITPVLFRKYPTPRRSLHQITSPKDKSSTRR